MMATRRDTEHKKDPKYKLVGGLLAKEYVLWLIVIYRTISHNKGNTDGNHKLIMLMQLEREGTQFKQ